MTCAWPPKGPLAGECPGREVGIGRWPSSSLTPPPTSNRRLTTNSPSNALVAPYFA
jgi:hypothetical protein